MDKYQRREAFLDDLDKLIKRTVASPSFRGQTQAVDALKRIQNLAVFK
jgi:hypothetical protein